MLACPACHADLQGVAIADENRECPFCGAALARGDDPATESIPSERSRGRGARGGATASDAPAADGLLPKSHVELIESGPDRLVLHIPPGGSSSSGIGCFALAWNAFLCVFTPPWLFAIAQGNGPPLLFIIPFLLVFWCVGLGFAYTWLKMKRTRTYLLIEPNRMVVQTERFGRKWKDESALGETARARLVESYKLNNVPVHRVEVQAEGRTIRFGTQLSEPEKVWIAEQINRFLQTDAVAPPGSWPATCTACGSSLHADSLPADERAAHCPRCGATVVRSAKRQQLEIPRVTSMDLPPDSPVQIINDDGERLSFWLPLLPPGKVRRGLAGSLIFVGVLGSMLGALFLWDQLHGGPVRPFDLVGVVAATLVTLSTLSLAVGGLLVARARLSVDLDSQWLCVRYHLGPLGMTRKMATQAIDAVRLRTSDDFAQHAAEEGRASSQPRADDPTVATVAIGKTFLVLTTLHDRDTAATVAGLVRTRLERLGVDLVA